MDTIYMIAARDGYDLQWFFKHSVYRRSTGFYIYIYDDESFTPPGDATGRVVYHHNPMSGCPNSKLNITVNRVAQGVAFYNERPSGFSTSCTGDGVEKL